MLWENQKSQLLVPPREILKACRDGKKKCQERFSKPVPEPVIFAVSGGRFLGLLICYRNGGEQKWFNKSTWLYGSTRGTCVFFHSLPPAAMPHKTLVTFSRFSEISTWIISLLTNNTVTTQRNPHASLALSISLVALGVFHSENLSRKLPKRLLPCAALPVTLPHFLPRSSPPSLSLFLFLLQVI